MRLIIYILVFVIAVLMFSPPVYAANECAHTEAYIVNADSIFEGVPGARALLRCSQETFSISGVVRACSEEGARYGLRADGSGPCYQNSGWKATDSNEGHVNLGNTNDGFDCSFGGNARLEVDVPSGWQKVCETDGSAYDCNSGSNINTQLLNMRNGSLNVIKVFYRRPASPVPTPTPTVTPKPGCEKSTCTYTENAPGVCPSGIRVVHGYGTTGHNQPGCNFVPGCSYTECEVPKSPTPTLPPGVVPSKTPTPTSCPVPKKVPNVRVECPYC